MGSDSGLRSSSPWIKLLLKVDSNKYIRWLFVPDIEHAFCPRQRALGLAVFLLFGPGFRFEGGTWVSDLFARQGAESHLVALSY